MSTTPEPGAVVAGTVTVQISASDADGPAPLAVEWNVDGGTWQPAVLNGSYYEAAWNTTAATEGAHTVNARATDGLGQSASDSNSVTPPSALTTVARRSRATLTFVMPAAPPVVMQRPSGAAGATLNVQLQPRTDAIVSVLARETGGSVLPVSATTDLSAAFRSILDRFRTTYVVYYNARGVETGGYHALDVKVKRDGVSVQARRGYWY